MAMNIVSPPLREHPEDVPQLVWHFLQHYSDLYGKSLEGIEPEALALLQQYSWPGNVRELENAMQRAIIMIHEIATAHRVPFNQAEREQLQSDLLDEVFGLGPLEPLLRDLSISDILVNNKR